MSHSAQAALSKLPVRNHARKGWKPDYPDPRDFHFKAERVTKLAELPSSVDLRDKCPSVYDQGFIGSCTANALGGNFEFLSMKEGVEGPFVPSRLFIYYNERVIENDVALDNGAQLRDGIKSLNQLGVCSEDLWPYDGTQADPKTSMWAAGSPAITQPTAECYKAALSHKVTSYERVAQNLDQMRGCLAAGFPLVIGFNTYSSFDGPIDDSTHLPEWYATAEVAMPDLSTESQTGGHAVCLVGYDNSKSMFLFRNSWGPTWGPNGGYGWIPYAYLTNPGLSSDFWTMRIVT